MQPGLLAEESLDGPEIGVEVVSTSDCHVVTAITHTQRGEAFEATGHLVAPALRSPATDVAQKHAQPGYRQTAPRMVPTSHQPGSAER